MDDDLTSFFVTLCLYAIDEVVRMDAEVPRNKLSYGRMKVEAVSDLSRFHTDRKISVNGIL